ncbi:hypothetical protein [Treponema denticola]|uniref:hypothetical protein n=1 Tax=Treponema denticola TaxID=158 RepID=UPI003D8BC984
MEGKKIFQRLYELKENSIKALVTAIGREDLEDDIRYKLFEVLHNEGIEFEQDSTKTLEENYTIFENLYIEKIIKPFVLKYLEDIEPLKKETIYREYQSMIDLKVA